MDTPSGTPELRRPANCTCAYPSVVARNMNGHDDACPVYVAWAEVIEHNRALAVFDGESPAHPPAEAAA